ncbi:MAG: DUF4924 family protein [Crocinitomicaceae bacterium]|nr:DUF4924 family protein [Crocinitomicaceae bacterium]
MFIIQEKKKKNVAEFLILMYQIEDLLRSFDFDISRIENEFIAPQVASPSLMPTMIEWYSSLVAEMKTNKLEKKGHVSEVLEVTNELIYLHNTLLTVLNDEKYKDLNARADQHISAFRAKSDLGNIHPVEVCLNALYMKLLFKMKGQTISNATEEAFDSMRVLLAYLTKKYHEMYQNQ